MRKFCISFLILTIIGLTVMGVAIGQNQTHDEYLRIHIRADSNEEQAQRVKYQIKDAVVNYLTPIIAKISTKEQAVTALNANLEGIEGVANAVLKENGFTYLAKASVKTELFPTRSYGKHTLEQGFYQALIIELGSAKGDNWWCVVYPPLCFTGADSAYQYKSKIYELIEKFYKNEKERK